ncbi:unnamed protein product [Parajaminaea phylloscopi]
MAPSSAQAGQKVARPVGRYRPGKAPVQDGYQDSDDEDDEQGRDDAGSSSQRFGPGGSTAIGVLHNNNNGLDGRPRAAGIVVSVGSAPIKMPSASVVKQEDAVQEYDSDEYETDTDGESDTKTPGPSTSRRLEAASESSEYETDSEEDEEESEPEPEPMLKPMFVSRKQREAQAMLKTGAVSQAAPEATNDRARDAAQEDPEALAERLAAARRQEAQELASERIKAELLAKQSEDAKPDLDDTDGLDPEAEFAAWRIRELQRIKREWEAEEAKEVEENERARREAMTDAQRDEEDMARAEAGRKEAREQRGKMGFMQKYYHKGAFFQDLDILKKRDYSTEQTEGALTNKESLPKMLQVRDGDVGKRGRSKWTHLGAEDTSKGGISLKNQRTQSNFGGASQGAGGVSEGCFHCGASDHLKRDCPVFEEERAKQKALRQREFERDRHQGWPQRSHRDRSRSPPRRPEHTHRDGAAARDHERYDRPSSHRHDRRDRDFERDSDRRRHDRPPRSSSPPQRGPPPPGPPPPRPGPPAVRDRWAERQRKAKEDEDRAADTNTAAPS